MSALPPCVALSPALFDSTKWPDHMTARKVCAACPMVTACIARALLIASERPISWRDVRGPDGTWGGLLWAQGSIDTRVHTFIEKEVAA